MTALQAIQLKQQNEERSAKQRRDTWRSILEVKNEELRMELEKHYCKPVRTGRRSG